MTRNSRIAGWAVVICIVCGPVIALAAPRLISVGASGGDLRVTLSDGSILKGSDLIGATLNISVSDSTLALRIDTAEADAHPEAPDVWLFGMTIVQPDVPDRPFCSPDPDGRQLAIPYPSPRRPEGFALTCTSGAVGK